MVRPTPITKRSIVTCLLGVFKVLEEGVLTPCNALADIGRGVGVALSLAGVAAKKSEQSLSASKRDGTGLTTCLPVQVGADLVGLARSDSVALGATSLEETSTLRGVTYTSQTRSAYSPPQDVANAMRRAYQERKACL
jgi:hypothetical protein